MINKILETVFPVATVRYRAYRLLIGNKNSFLYSSGWIKSLQTRKPLDAAGMPVPWMNYGVIKLLDERLHANMNLFEYGSGFSTLFYASRVRSVTSTEHDKTWVDSITEKLPSNARIILRADDEDGEYCRTISTTGQRYDVVVIDGRDRVNCVRQSIPYLTATGVILLDDSDREEYSSGFNILKTAGFKCLSIDGLKPRGGDGYRTTIFYKENNCLGL